MDSQTLEALPAERRQAAQLAIATAFGTAEVNGVQQVFGGVSALAYRVEIGEQPYLLRLDARNAARNPERGYLCMRAAAEAGIAPRVHHADTATGVALMDFVMQRPLDEYPGGSVRLVKDLGRLISQLQALPAFPAVGDYLNIVGRMFNYVRSSNLFVSGLLDLHAAEFEKIRTAYRCDPASLVASHNDPNPRNILFDGDRLWLIDWETAFANDPLADVAIVADNFAHTPDLETALLEAWTGREADRMVRARLTIMRPVTRLYYFCLGASLRVRIPRTTPETDIAALSPTEFRLAVNEGRLKPGASETAYALGKMYLGGYMTGVQSSEFDEALGIVAK